MIGRQPLGDLGVIPPPLRGRGRRVAVVVVVGGADATGKLKCDRLQVRAVKGNSSE